MAVVGHHVPALLSRSKVPGTEILAILDGDQCLAVGSDGDTKTPGFVRETAEFFSRRGVPQANAAVPAGGHQRFFIGSVSQAGHPSGVTEPRRAQTRDGAGRQRIAKPVRARRLDKRGARFLKLGSVVLRGLRNFWFGIRELVRQELSTEGDHA